MRQKTFCEDCKVMFRLHSISEFKGKMRCHGCRLKASESICQGSINTSHKDDSAPRVIGGRLGSGFKSPLCRITLPHLTDDKMLVEAIRRAVE